MTDGGKNAQAAIPCSKGVTAVSTRCRGARRSDVRLIAGNGGAPAANFAGGAAVAMAAREQSSVRAKQRGNAGEKNEKRREKRSYGGLKTGEARARGGHRKQPGRRCRHALATRRGMPDAVGRIRAQGGRRQRAGVGWAEAKARAREDRWAGFG